MGRCGIYATVSKAMIARQAFRQYRKCRSLHIRFCSVQQTNVSRRSEIESYFSKIHSDGHKIEHLVDFVLQGTTRDAISLLDLFSMYPCRYPPEMSRIACVIDQHSIESESDIIQAFNALRGMSSISEPEKNIIVALTNMLRRTSDTDISGNALSLIIDSMKLLPIKERVIVTLLSEITSKIRNCPDNSFTARDISLCLGGLTNKSCDVREVTCYLEALAPKIEHSPDTLTDCTHISAALNGLQNMQSTNNSVCLVVHHIANNLLRLDELDLGSRPALTEQQLCAALVGLRHMTSSSSEVRLLLKAVYPLMISCPDPFSGQSIALVLSAFSGLSPKYEEVRQVLSAAAIRVRGYPDRENAQFLFAQLSVALHGLRFMTCQVVAVHSLLISLEKRFHFDGAKGDVATEEDMSLALLGLQSMSCSVRPVRKLLQYIARSIDVDTLQPSPRCLSNAWHGLKNMLISSKEVISVVRILTRKTRQCEGTFTYDMCGMALYGLREMSCDVPEVREAVTALHSHILRNQRLGGCVDSTDIPMKSIAMCIHGLKTMTAEHEEVRSLLGTLAVMLASTKENICPFELSLCFVGLLGKSSDVKEVRAILEALHAKILLCEKRISFDNISDSLYALQHMNSNCMEVRQVLAAFASILTEQSQYRIPPEKMWRVGAALYGMQGMDPGVPEVQSILSALANYIRQIEAAI